MTIKKVIAGILLVATFANASYGQTHKDSVIAEIRRNFQRTNNDRSLRVIELDEEEFLGEGTDNGGDLKGYFKGDTLCKMVLEVGLSYSMKRWEYYFDKGKVIFIYETDRYYPQDSVNGGLDNTRLELAFEGRYYYENGVLINTLFKGKKRLLDTSSNSTTAYINALPKKPEIDGYIKLLRKKMK
jgi:hypothetical protein